jgi:O-antigen ligase
MTVKETLSYIYQNPFLGMGMSHLIDLQNLSYGKEHNNYLSIAASFGILTLIFYILFVILLFIMLHKRIKKISQNPLTKNIGIVLGAGFLALIVFLNFAPAEFHFIWIWFGLAAAWLRNCEDELLLRKPAINKLCDEKI